jgi:hypothetical protein
LPIKPLSSSTYAGERLPGPFKRSAGYLAVKERGVSVVAKGKADVTCRVDQKIG